MSSTRKCYGQICPMATALDVVGDRWTLLLLRELLGGSARFHELQDGLPGIAKNLLSSRLRRLEGDGIIRRVTSHGTTRYALTDLGAAVRPTLEELGFWGSRLDRVGAVEHDRSIRAIAMALHAILVRVGSALPAKPLVVELDVAGEHVEVVLGPKPSVTAGSSTDADARVRVSREVLSSYLLGASFDSASFVLVAGEPGAREALVGALAVMVAG